MFQQIINYIKFLITSKNQHGVHSPFVYDLLTKCLYQKPSSEIRNKLIKFRKDLLFDRRIIEVKDYGAGSKIFRSNRRKISDLAKHVGMSKKRAKLLYQLTNYFEPSNVLELGTSLGISTCALAMGNPKATITSLEGCDQTADAAVSMFNKYNLTNIEVIKGDFKNTYFDVLRKTIYDLIFFDGNHTKDATLNYFEACLDHVHNQSILLFDDIYWSKEMQDAWQQIKNHPRVSVTIDTYQWGFVFLRKEQQKEHFTIRV